MAKHKPFNVNYRTVRNKAKLLALAGDETRLRVMCCLFGHDKICVSDVAGKLGLSVAVVSHHLQQLHGSGLAVADRAGKRKCYSLKKTAFIKQLKKIMCMA